MKNTSLIINGVLGIAIIILFILHFTEKKEHQPKPFAMEGDSTIIRLPVAYVNTDSLLLNYNYAQDLNETLLRKTENSRANLNQKGSRLQSDMLEFQRKVDNNAFLNQERAQNEYNSLMKRQQDLQDQITKAEEELLTEQFKLNQQMTDTVINALREYNSINKYQIIFNNVGGTNNILISDNAYDITADIINYLNKRYQQK